MRVHLEIHHIEYRSRGGTHVTSNLITLCCAHHGLVHEGICGVTGEAPDKLTWRRPYVAGQPALPVPPVTPLMEEELAPASPAEESAAEETPREEIIEEGPVAFTEEEEAATEGAAMEEVLELPPEDESASESWSEGLPLSDEETQVLYVRRGPDGDEDRDPGRTRVRPRPSEDGERGADLTPRRGA